MISQEGILKFYAYEVDPNTICCLTGMCDKHKVEICDKDNIIFNIEGKDEKGGIEWNGNSLAWTVRADNCILPLSGFSQYEINIVENSCELQ